MRRPVFPMLIGGSVMIVSFASALAVDAEADTRSVDDANKLLLKVSKAYTSLPAMTDEMTLTYSAPGMPETVAAAKIRISGDAAEAKGIAQSFDIHVLDGHLYMKFVGADGIMKVKLDNDPHAVLKEAMGPTYPYLPPQMALRWANGIEDVGEWFGFGVLTEPAVAGHAMVDGKNGLPVHEVLFNDKDGGTSHVRIHPETYLIEKIVAKSAEQPNGMVVTISSEFKPTVLDKLDDPIAFDVEGAQFYDTFDAMMASSMGDINPSVEVGSAAPTFELADQHGTKHASSAYRGKIMMLDWWGVW